LLSLGIEGNLIGGIGLCFGSLASTATLRLLLRWIRKADPPVPLKSHQTGLIR
jgi:hypothetical protein